MAEAVRSSYPEQLRDLLAGVAGLYRAAFRAGVSYWSEVVASGLRYQADTLDSVMTAVRDPRRSQAALTGSYERFKRYVQQSGDSAERAIIDFNQALEAAVRGPAPASFSRTSAGTRGGEGLNEALRGLADAAIHEVLRSQDAGTPPDLRALRQHLEGLLAEIRQPESTATPPPADSASPASAPQRL